MEVYKPVYPGLYYFDTFTFTTLGTSGHRGPETTKMYTNAPWREGDFSIVNGQQKWRVPATGTYHVEAAGAYGVTPGRVVSGDVNLNEGQTLTMLVGQEPTPLTANVADATTVGGGGGTFVVSGGVPLIVASGGDGTGGHAASFSPYGTGNGKNGGGYLSNGLATNSTFKFLKPEAYVNGGFGNIFPTGVVPEEGGFGGGQSPVTSGISGGGGYTGSPGNGVSGATCYAHSSVRNFKDLGAASNTAGYVNVSLIDPIPLKKTWTWNKIVQTTSTGPYRTIQWSAELNKFLSMSGSSTDGLTWASSATAVPTIQTLMFVAYSPSLKIYVGVLRKPNLTQFFLAYSRDAVTWTYLFDTLSSQSTTSAIIWSEELSLFVLFEGPRVWRSNDGTTWVVSYTTSGGFLTGMTYAPAINTFVATQYPLPVYSTDGINWSFASTPDSGSWKSVAWSPTLNLFITVSPTSQTGTIPILYSTDGQTWTNDNIDAPPELYWSVVIWSDLGIFSVLGPSGHSMYSYDGIHWTVLNIPVVSPDAVTYSPSLGLFVCVANTSRFLVSIEGKFWIPRSIYSKGNSGAWSSQLGMFVTSDGYTSYDGLTWINQNSDFGFRQIIWIPELGLFIGVQTSYYYSYDGITWINSNYTGVVSFITWSPELGIIVGTAYSRDGIHWVDSFNGSGDVYFSPGWSKGIGIFTGIATNSSYYSYDGIHWTRGSFSGVFSFTTSSTVWSPKLHMFICTGVSGVSSSYVYSYDGLNWTQLTPGFSIYNVTWNNELSLFISGFRSSVDGITWLAYPSQTNVVDMSNMWSPELGRFVTRGGYSYVNKSF